MVAYDQVGRFAAERALGKGGATYGMYKKVLLTIHGK